MVAAGVAILILVLFAGLLEANRPRVGGDSLRLDTFVDLVERGSVRSARILDFDNYVIGRYRADDGEIRRYNAAYLDEGRERQVTLLLDHGVATRVDPQTNKRLASVALYLLPGLLLVLLFVYLILSSQRGTGLFKVRSGARRISAETGAATFADVAGQDAAVAELREIRDFLADPARYAAVGAQIPKGVLLYGPPGCGKTLLARAVAGEAKACFYSISGSDFVEVYVGVGAARVRDLFRVARENAPAVIFIDELDSIGRSRGSAGGLSSEREQALNQVLAEMDGFSSSDGLIVLAATNRPDVLDPALLRPGRFDRSVGLERPDEAARRAILQIHAQTRRLAPDASLAAVATRAVGFTGADLASVLNEAALLAARAGRADIGPAQLDEAVQRILNAPERQRRLSLREKSIGRRYGEDDKVTFADVAGQNAAVAELREVRDFLAEPGRYAAVGATVPRGVMLFGPPGCGKTLMARALAGETNAAFFAVSASEFSSRYVGDGAERVRTLFAEARQMAPSIVFIDEIDSLGGSRAGSAGDRAPAQQHEEEALNQLLTELDGFSPSSGVIVVAATNRPDVLDPALIRPGRFDRTIGLEWPSAEARLAILALHAGGKPLAPDVRLDALAGRAHGLTGAELANVVNEAALLAARDGRSRVGRADLDLALDRTFEAPDRQRRLSLRARSVGRRFAGEERVTFADVAGVDDAVEELRDVTEYLAEPQRFLRLGAAPPRGILLSGPPGCGKTLLARAVAGEANAAFISTSGSEFVEVFAGEGAARVRDLFAEARSMAPAIVFIDEVDAVGGHRSAGARRELDSTLNQLLVELDGFEGREAVIVMAATNRPDILDPALLRPGRFDRKVDVTLPDRAGRRAVLAVHAGQRPLAPDVDLDALAGLTQGFSGADLANVMNEAALLATRRGLDRIPMAVVDEAVDRAYLGISSRGHLMTDEEKRVVAYHEAGHALAARGLEGASPMYKLTILPRGGTLGHCAFLDDHDRTVVSRSALMARMAAFLGGWVAESLVFGEPGSGASSDLRVANALARRMVLEYGMSEEFGPATPVVGRGPDGQTLALPGDVARAVRRLVEEAAGMARSALTSRRLLLDRVAEALLDRETLSRDEVEALVSAPPGRRRPSEARGAAARVEPAEPGSATGPTTTTNSPRAELAYGRSGTPVRASVQ
ncbi:MAG TPA: AAA family ATPase, partial [Acidimicrobiales bacterium]|nr:AAA family ATPase [Acidimicrobiales bacterium]